ncbi:hypothetical protein [Actinophytocola sp.]|uniref:hypothetical protein n=1 Tax=Actinophytocola sp. TaxID=1872138 RepID=UPI00389AD0F7
MSLFSTFAGGALTAGSLAAGNAKAMLVPETFGLPVVFDVNPKSVDVKRKAKSQGNKGTVANPLNMSAQATSAVQLKLSDARLVGALNTRSSVETLLEWAEPKPVITMGSVVGAAAEVVTSTAATARAALGGAAASPALTRTPGIGGVSLNKTYELPVLLFMWGIGGPVGGGAKVQLTELKASYVRFDWTGMPVMAKLEMTLEMYEQELDFTNPSSGGVPGRSQHLLADGENVIGVATAKYGTPHAWRAVAEANGLDDPLRVRSGRVLHLPGPSELGQEVAT